MVAFVLAAIAIKLTLWLLHPWQFPNRTSQYRQKFYQVFALPRYLAEVVPASLRSDAIAVIWLL